MVSLDGVFYSASADTLFGGISLSVFVLYLIYRHQIRGTHACCNTLLLHHLHLLCPSPKITMDFLAGQGAHRNNNGGIFVQGIAYGFKKKIEVTDAYRRCLEEGGLHTSQVAIAKECKVSRKFVVKIINKLIEHGKIIPH